MYMTKMAAMPIYGKTLQSSFKVPLGSDFCETLYEASETLALYVLFKL